MSLEHKELINIEGKEIGGSRTFIIAEVGSNHRQDINIALDLIAAASESGADAVKFQSVNIKELYHKPSASIKKLHKQIDLNEKWHYDLKTYADKKGIVFFSSPTYIRAVDILEEIGVKLYKLASAQLGTFPQIIKKVANCRKPTLISTGLVTYEELNKAIRVFHSVGNYEYIILHCNSIYPTPYDKVNLSMINVYENMFGNPVGFSDHTIGIHIAVAAVAKGAKVIEKHIKLDNKVDTPDSSISLNPKEFSKLVSNIRETEQSFEKKIRLYIEQEEQQFKEGILYRLILKCNKKRGEKFSENDFIFKRNNNGIDCRDLDVLIERMVAKHDLKKNSLLMWDMLEGK